MLKDKLQMSRWKSATIQGLEYVCYAGSLFRFPDKFERDAWAERSARRMLGRNPEQTASSLSYLELGAGGAGSSEFLLGPLTPSR